MPRGDEIYVSKWLKASDLEDDEATFTITGSDVTSFKERNGQEKQQIYLEFSETDKPFGLNKTNYGVLQSIFRSPETDDWVGKKVVLFVTQTSMDNQTVDCLRIKRKATETINAKPARKLTPEQAAPPPARPRPPRATAPVTQQEADSDEDIPFRDDEDAPY